MSNLAETKPKKLKISPLVSIIVPMYNTELYIGETLRSLQSQTLKDIEIIVVNDGTKDDGVGVVEKVAEQDGRIRLIHKKNGGLSSARNTGAREAKGQFLYFLDSDDWIEPETLSTAVQAVTNLGCEYAIFRGRIFDETDHSYHAFYDWRIWNKLSFGSEDISAVASWDKQPALIELEPQIGLRLFGREFFISNNLWFPEGLHYEDFPVHIKSLLSTQRIALINKEFFFYRVGRPNKITDQRNKKRLDILKVYEISLDCAINAKISGQMDVERGGLFVHAIMRMVGWCETFVPTKLLDSFIDRLFELIDKTPKDWIDSALARSDEFVGRQVRISLAKTGRQKAYKKFATGRRATWSVARVLIARGQLLSVANNIIAKKIDTYLTRVALIWRAKQ